jgi:hypothetical protein
MADFVIYTLTRNRKHISFCISSADYSNTRSDAHIRAPAVAPAWAGNAGLKLLAHSHRNSSEKRNIFLLRLVPPTDNSGR